MERVQKEEEGKKGSGGTVNTIVDRGEINLKVRDNTTRQEALEGWDWGLHHGEK